MTGPHSSMPALAAALDMLARQIDSEDGVANAVCAEASGRLAQVHADLATLAPHISAAAGKASRRSKAGQALRAAADRLIAEVIA